MILIVDAPAEVVIAPPFPYLADAKRVAAPQIQVSAQNIYDKVSGAYTGEVRWIDWRLVGSKIGANGADNGLAPRSSRTLASTGSFWATPSAASTSTKRTRCD